MVVSAKMEAMEQMVEMAKMLILNMYTIETLQNDKSKNHNMDFLKRVQQEKSCMQPKCQPLLMVRYWKKLHVKVNMDKKGVTLVEAAEEAKVDALAQYL